MQHINGRHMMFLAAILSSSSILPWAIAPAAAQEAETAASDDSLMGDIVVTARRRTEAAQSVPVSINAFSQEQLRAAGITANREIQKITPGLQWKSAGPLVANNIFIRGVGIISNQYTSSPAVGVYQDETYFNSQGFQGFANFDIERIEVLKGPQGTLYGRNTTAGAIKFVTRKPKIGAGFTGNVNVDYGNFDYWNVEGGIGADLGENAAIRIGFQSQDRDGLYYDYINDRHTGILDTKAVRAELLFEPDDALSILVSGSYGKSKSNGPFKRVDSVDPASISFGPNGPTYSGRCANPGIGTAPGCTSLLPFFGVPDEANTNAYDVQFSLDNDVGVSRVEAYGGALTVNYDFGGAILTSATSYYELKAHNPNDVDTVDANLVTINDDINPKQFSQELRLTSDGDTRFKWLLGAFYYRENILQAKPVNIAAIGIGLGNRTRQVTDAASLFAEATYSLTDKIDLTAGLRYSHDKRDVDFTYFFYFNDGVRALYSYDDIVNGPGFGPGSFRLPSEKKSWDNVSGRAILSYKFTPDVMAYASFSRGFKGGEFNVGASQLSTAIFVNPETVNAYEIGLKSEFFDHRLRINAAAFYYDYDNKQETFFDTGVAVLSNASARVKGFELGVTAQPVPGLTLNGGLALLDAKYRDFPDCLPGGISCDGNRLPLAPKTSANLLARYEFEVGGRTVAIQGDASYQSSVFFDYQNVAYIATDGYWLTNARVSYELTDNLTLAVWGQNLANKQYYTDGFNVSDFGIGELNPGIPRTYGASIQFSF